MIKLFIFYDHKVIDEADEEALSMFMKNEPKQRKTIADIIMEKMREQELQGNRPQSTEPAAPKLHPKVIQVYRGYFLFLVIVLLVYIYVLTLFLYKELVKYYIIIQLVKFQKHLKLFHH